MSKSNLRLVVRLVLLFTLVSALSLTQVWATTIGSPTILQADQDTATGVVAIYTGNAFFNTGDTIANFSWIGKTFSGSEELTPLLFQSNGEGQYTVVGIGTAITVSGATNNTIQSDPFRLVAGSSTVGADTTFGFVAGTVDPDGGSVSGSAGSVSFFNGNLSSPTVGSGINDWEFTPSTDTAFTITLGSTFGGNGTPLNNADLGGFNIDRTYSAQATSNASGVAEPGTFSLITGAGLVFAGLFRYRYSRGRKS